MRRLSAKQIEKKLIEAKVDTKDFKFGTGYVEVYIKDSEGRCDHKLTEEATDKVFEIFLGRGFGGYSTGYGAWILKEGYSSNGDWNDKSSKCHY